MRILGVDPGLANTGYGVLDWVNGRATVVEAGVIGTKSGLPLAERIRQIHREMAQIVVEFQPEVMAVEDLYTHYNHPRTAVLMGHARGVMFLAAAQHDVEVAGYSPARIKKAVTGNGNAAKQQVQFMVQTLLGLDAPPSPDHVADALAAALCHGATIGG